MEPSLHSFVSRPCWLKAHQLVPEWVDDVASLLRWLEQTGETSGGVLESPDHLGVGTGLLKTDPAIGDVEVLLIDDHRVRFPQDESVLIFGMIIEVPVPGASTGGWVDIVDYNFHYQDVNDRLIRRYDKHPGEEHVVGGLTHVHIGAERNIHRAPEVGLDDAFEMIRRRFED